MKTQLEELAREWRRQARCAAQLSKITPVDEMKEHFRGMAKALRQSARQLKRSIAKE